MHVFRTIVIAAVVCSAASTVSTADPSRDPIGRELISPDQLLQFREQVGLSDEQVEQIRAVLDHSKPGLRQLHQQVERHVQALAKQLAKEDVDEAVALEQLDALLASEHQLRRSRLARMIKVKNLLTAKQQNVAKQLSDPHRDMRAIEQRLRSKLSRVESELRRRVQAGQPPQQALQRMQRFHQSMQSSQHQKAESILDQVLRDLDVRDTRSNDEDASQVRPPGRHPEVVAPARDSVLAVQQAIDRLYVEDVAWRKIPWKTCLLDGINASQQQHKPMLLWVFIDRPIDDERC